MAQIFSSPYAKTQVINVAGASISYKAVPNGTAKPDVAAAGKGKTLPFGVQEVRLQIQRPTQQSFGISAEASGKLTRYLYMGQTTGSLVLQGLFGPSSSISKFAKELQDGCASLTFWITPSMTAGCTTKGNKPNAGQTLKVFGCTLDSFNFQYQMGQGGIASIKYPLQFRLTGLQIMETAAAGNTGAKK